MQMLYGVNVYLDGTLNMTFQIYFQMELIFISVLIIQVVVIIKLM